jgi:hypothetical protein
VPFIHYPANLILLIEKYSALVVISVLDTKEMMPSIPKPKGIPDGLLLCALAVTSIRVMAF